MSTNALPYKIACLAYLFDPQGRVLLLHRHKEPNLDLYSPIGGKLETAIGESPTACAAREIQEESGLDVPVSDLHLTGIVSETAFNGETHWLMFLYEVTRPVTVEPIHNGEGQLEWHEPNAIDQLPIPDTDRRVIWPLFWKHRHGFFAAHIDCSDPAEMTWAIEQSAPAQPA